VPLGNNYTIAINFVEIIYVTAHDKRGHSPHKRNNEKLGKKRENRYIIENVFFVLVYSKKA